MAIIIQEGFDVNAPFSIDKRLIVDRANGTTSSLVSLIPQYNYANMYVWVKEEKTFYYLNNTVNDNGNPGATISDWTRLSTGSSSTTPDSLINAKRVAWQVDTVYPTMPGQTNSWGLTAGQDPNTVWFYNGGNSFDSPQGDIVVSINPATATPGLNRDFKFILGNGGRVETGNTWSVAYNGTRLVEYGEGRVEPHVLDFNWATSSRAPNGEYLLSKYVVEIPADDYTTTGNAYGRDFSVKRLDNAFFSGGANVSTTGVGSSSVFPKGSILFVDESFVTCEGITGSVTGVTISFGLSIVTAGGTIGATISNFEPQLSQFGISNSYEMLFAPKALGDFFTGSVFYSKSPIGIIRLTQPAMLVMKPVGGSVAIGTYLKYRIPYIVDEDSVNSISGTNYISGPGIATGATGCAKSGYVSGASFTGNPATANVVFSTPYSSASYSVAVTSQAFTADDYVYSITNKLSTGFTIRVDNPSPIGATAMWITNCYDGSGLSSGGSGGGNAAFLPLPIPKINLMQGTQEVEVYNSATNTISGTSAVIYNYPVLINMDFTSDHFSNPNNKIFIEMVYYRRKSRKSIPDPAMLGPNTVKKKGKSYVVPSKNIADAGQDTTLPWIVAAMAVGATGSWSRSGSQNYFTGVPIGIDRPNHVEVTGYTISSYPIWQYLNGRFEFYDVTYADATTGSPLTLQTLIPNSGKGKAGKNLVQSYTTNVGSSGSRFPYSPYYTPYYCAFRYIQWIPNVNPRPGGGYYGQIVSGPLSKVIKVTGLNFPFQTNYQQSAVFDYPVCDISAYWTANPDSYRTLKCDWESNVP